MMPKLAVITWPYNRYSLERAFEGISDAGYKYVSFGLHHEGQDQPDESDPEASVQIGRLLNRYELQPVTLVGTKQFAPGQPIERAIARLDFAWSLGISEVLSLGAWGFREFPNDPLPAEELAVIYRRFVEHFKRIGEEAGKRGIVVSLKPHTGNTATAAHLVELLREIGSPHVKASYDPGNVHYYEGISSTEDFPLIAAETVSFVAKDHKGPRYTNSFPIPGNGDVDFPALFKTLFEHRYEGPIIVERADPTGSEPQEPQYVDQRMKSVRLILERMLQEAGYGAVSRS